VVLNNANDAKQQKGLNMEQTELIGISRRRLLAMSSISAVATLLAGLGRFTSSGNAKASDLLTTTFRTNTSFGPIKQIDSGLLNVGYAESGLAKGPQSFSFTVGPTTFTALSMLRPYWQREVTE
jgi:hypothetical protein